jgi:hypothetical protein
MTTNISILPLLLGLFMTSVVVWIGVVLSKAVLETAKNSIIIIGL